MRRHFIFVVDSRERTFPAGHDLICDGWRLRLRVLPSVLVHAHDDSERIGGGRDLWSNQLRRAGWRRFLARITDRIRPEQTPSKPDGGDWTHGHGRGGCKRQQRQRGPERWIVREDEAV